MTHLANRTAVLIFCSLILLLIAFRATAQEARTIPTLEPMQPMERDLSIGQPHQYQIKLQAGQATWIEVEQRGINVVLYVFAPDGKRLCWMNKQSRTTGTERALLVAEVTGGYRISVEAQRDATANNLPPGKYEIKLTALHPVADHEQRQFQAQNLWSEGTILLSSQEPKQAAAGAKLLEEWVLLNNGLDGEREKANTLVTLGKYYRRQREIQTSLEKRHQALQIARALHDQRLEMEVLEGIGTVYLWMRDFPTTLSYYQQSLQLAQQLGEKSFAASLMDEWSGVLAQMAGYFNGAEPQKYRGGLSPQYKELLEQSCALYREINDPMEASPLSFLALWYAWMGERKTAQEHIARVRLLSQSMAKPSQRLMKIYTAHVLSVLGDYQQALELREQAYREGGSDPDGLANVLLGVAAELRNLGRWAEARERIEEVIRVKESLYRRLSDQEHRMNVASNIAGAYEFYTDLLMRMHEQKPEEKLNELAFIATERARARALLELLNEARVNLRADVAPTLLTREVTLQQQLNSLTPRPDDPRKEQLLEANKQAINVALEELRTVRAQIRQASPRFAELTDPQPPTLHEIQTQLLDADTMLLAYALSENRSFLWAITPEAVTHYVLPPRDEITRATRRVYELLTMRQQAGKTEKEVQQADAAHQQAAASLSQMLLGAVAPQLGKKRLLIVAPEALQYLPFGALPEPGSWGLGLGSLPNRQALAVTTKDQKPKTKAQPLIVNHEIISLPSVSVMMLLRQELAQRKAALKAVAVLADPVFEANDPRVKAKARSEAVAPLSPLGRSLRSFDARAGLARLMLSRDEAEAIAAAVPAAERLKAVDFQASRTAAMSAELSQYRIVHFATHGLLNAERPELSGLVFSMVDEQGKPQDGFLRAHELYNLKLPAELVVLSACQSGLGKEIKGEGLIGLTRGFMYAGAGRVVASLWRVDDYATSVLMKKFYRGMLQEKLPAAAALRKAQIEMWKQKQWQSPFYWGAFVLQGEWR